MMKIDAPTHLRWKNYKYVDLEKCYNLSSWLQNSASSFAEKEPPKVHESPRKRKWRGRASRSNWSSRARCKPPPLSTAGQPRHSTLSEARSRLYQHRFSQYPFFSILRDLQNDLSEFLNFFEFFAFFQFQQNFLRIRKFRRDFAKIYEIFQNFAEFWKIKLDHFVDLEKCWKISIG